MEYNGKNYIVPTMYQEFFKRFMYISLANPQWPYELDTIIIIFFTQR